MPTKAVVVFIRHLVEKHGMNEEVVPLLSVAELEAMHRSFHEGMLSKTGSMNHRD